MSTLPAVRGGAPREPAISAALEMFSPAKIELLKRTLCADASDDELELFLAQCQRTGLDPFLRQIIAIRRYDGRQQREVMTTLVTIDGFRLLADRTGRYVPGRETTFVRDNDGRLISATVYVKKLVAGEWHEISETALFAEACQRNRKTGEPLGTWAEMPHVMTAKVAEARVLRRAFPAEMSGLYSPDEMHAAADREMLEEPIRVNRTTGEVLPPDAPQSAPTAPPARSSAPAAPRVAGTKDEAIVEAEAALAARKAELRRKWALQQQQASAHGIDMSDFPEHKTCDEIVAEAKRIAAVIKATIEQERLDAELDDKVAADKDPFASE